MHSRSPRPSGASGKTPQCGVSRDRQDIHYESSILIESKDMLRCPLKASVHTLCISLKYIQKNYKMAQTRQPSNMQSTFYIDAADKQHNHITKLHKHPREQTRNKFCMD